MHSFDMAMSLRWVPVSAVLLALGVVVAFWLTGCASPGPYRAPSFGPNQLPTTEDHSDKGYRIGFVEFDDQGWFWTPEREQLLAVEQMIAEASQLDTPRPRPLILIAFVHGWKNNASADPENNAAAFQSELEQIASAEKVSAQAESRPPRPVVGVYIGWPGLSLKRDPLMETTFYARKSAGDRVGDYGGVTEVLTRIEALNNEINHPGETRAPALAAEPNDSSRSYFVVVGHSFGAQVVYDSLLPVMTEGLSSSKVAKLAQNLRSRRVALSAIAEPNSTTAALGENERVRPFADLVVLVNPAFEAERYFNLQTLATRFQYAPGQRPVLAIFLSEGDSATGFFFPLGRSLSTLFHRYRPDDLKTLQKRADTHTVPWTDDFVTHTLVPEPPGTTASPPGSPDEVWSVAGRTKPILVGGNLLSSVPGGKPWTPFYVVKVDASIIADHDDIWNGKFQATLTDFVADVTRTRLHSFSIVRPGSPPPSSN